MSDVNQDNAIVSTDPLAPTELSLLKDRARLMGIQFSNNIGVEALRVKIEARQKGQVEDETKTAQVVEAAVSDDERAPNPLEDAKPAPKTLRQLLIQDEMKLIRLRITNMDPKKKDLHGEIYTIANEYLGTVRKFIPFGEATENGYHVPHCLYQLLKTKKFLNIRVIKRQNGQDRVETSYQPEFSLEVLPQLTPKELERLATAQVAAGVFAEDGGV